MTRRGQGFPTSRSAGSRIVVLEGLRVVAGALTTPRVFRRIDTAGGLPGHSVIITQTAKQKASRLGCGTSQVFEFAVSEPHDALACFLSDVVGIDIPKIDQRDRR